MKKLIMIFLLISSPAWAAVDTHYVTQSGAGSQNGSSLANAFSVANFNSSANWDTDVDDDNKVGPGDTVFFSGTITSQIFPPAGPTYGGTSGNYITLDGWEGGTCNPVANQGCSSAAVIDLPSRTNSASNYSFRIDANSYLIIQDFNMTDSYGGIYSYGPSTGTDATNLTIRRNYIHDMAGKGAQITAYAGGDYLAHDYVTFGGALGDGNYVWDVNEDCLTGACDTHDLGFNHGEDLVVSYNHVGRNSGDQDLTKSSTGISIHTGDRALIEYNTIEYPHGQSNLSVKEWGGTDKIVRFNKIIGAGDTAGISISAADGVNQNIYVYGNLVFASASGIRAYKNYDEVHIWSNITHNIVPESTDAYCFYFIYSSGDTAGDVYLYNNTCSRSDINGSSSTKDSGLRIYGSADLNLRVKNNIFYYNVFNDSDRHISVESGTESYVTALDYNIYYSGGDTPYFYWNGENRTLAWMVANTDFCDNDSTSDPAFTDPDGADNTHGTVGDDYTLSSGRAIDSGIDLGGTTDFSVTVQGTTYDIGYAIALDPDTDWTTTPPTIYTIDQDESGSWEKGAYGISSQQPITGVTIGSGL